MQRARLFILILSSLVSSLALAEVTIKDVKSNSAANSVLYSVKEGFVKLDQVNTVYGVEILLKKGFVLPAKYRVKGADSPETDFSFLNKYTLSTTVMSELTSGTVVASGTAKPEVAVSDELIDTPVTADEVRLVTGAAKTYIQDETGQVVYEIEWKPKPEQNVMVMRGCPQELLKLREVKNTQVAFPMGISCNFAVSPGLVTISLPQEARWSSANLVEVSGKGERYRTFEIPQGNLEGKASGAFRFKQKDQTLTYAVFVKKLEEKAATLSIGFDKSVYFGMASSALGSDTASYSSSSFFYEFSGLTDFVWSYFKFGFGFYNSFSMGEDPAVVSSRDSKVTVGYYSNNKTGLNYGVWTGHRNFDVKQDLSSTKFQSSQFAFGADATYTINPKNTVIGKFEMASLGSKVVKSHMKIGAYYKYKMIIGKTEYIVGGLFETQNMQMATATGDSRKFDLTKFGLLLDF
ncbi:hypothetical protein [Pseudobdellovibrio sp. HCB154]|uniref:hypothetical protein n=1 Tax=Pseudobdellovibrio sp. HCB154 TaxID=3386277 RepID=UPI003916E38E